MDGGKLKKKPRWKGWVELEDLEESVPQDDAFQVAADSSQEHKPSGIRVSKRTKHKKS